MIAIRGNDVKKNFKEVCDRVYEGEVTIISRPKNRNIVMVSEQFYQELERARRNLEYLAKIDRAIAQKENGTMQEHELTED